MTDGPGLILLMGGRTEHAITSIQFFVPSVVHIVTSTDFKSQHSRRLKSWSEKYGFRKGDVHAVDDLFEPTAISSLLSLICKVADKEDFNESEISWHIGITGGTMHMAATGMYSALLLRMKAFYVIQPPKGQEPMPNRDVLEFPSFHGMGAAMALKAEDIVYLSQGEGKMEEFAQRMPEFVFQRLCGTGLLSVKEDIWKATPEGLRTLEFAGRSMPVMEVLQMVTKKAEEEENQEEDSGFYHG
jgi:hypothetical protein